MENAIMEKRAPTSTVVKCRQICMSGRRTFRFVLFVGPTVLQEEKEMCTVVPKERNRKTKFSLSLFLSHILVEKIPKSVRTNALRSLRLTAGNRD